MGLFSQNTEAVPASHHRRSGSGRHTNSHSEKRRHSVIGRHMNERPTFGEWIRTIWLDILTMAAMGTVGLGVCWAAVHVIDIVLIITNTVLRFTWLPLRRLAPSRFTSRMGRLCIPNSHTRSAEISSPSGSPRSSRVSSPSFASS